MARERVVSRTITSYNYEVMCVDTTTANVSITTYTLTGDKLDDTKALKQLKKLYETDTTKLVTIQTVTETEELYVMPEVDFIKLAKKADPATRKALAPEYD